MGSLYRNFCINLYRLCIVGTCSFSSKFKRWRSCVKLFFIQPIYGRSENSRFLGKNHLDPRYRPFTIKHGINFCHSSYRLKNKCGY